MPKKKRQKELYVAPKKKVSKKDIKSQLDNELELLEKTIKISREQHAEAKVNMEKERKDLNEKVGVVRAEFDEASKKKKDLDREAYDVSIEIEGKKLKLSTLLTTIDQQQKNAQKAHQQNKEQLKAEFDDFKEKTDKKRKNLEEEVEKLEEKASDLTAKVADIGEKLQNLELKFTELKKALADTHQVSEDNEKDIQASELLLKDLEERIIVVAKTLKKSEKKIASQQKKDEELNQRKVELDERKDKLTKDEFKCVEKADYLKSQAKYIQKLYEKAGKPYQPFIG